MDIIFDIAQLILINLILLEVKKCEYNIKDGQTSYLYSELMKTDNNVILDEIELKILLSRIVGTLLYVIDKNENQLILSLYEEIEEILKIEFRGEENFYSLNKLCGCIRCRYQLIKLKLRISDFIFIKCNEKDDVKIEYKDKKLNSAYPILKKTDKEQAVIWLINTPKHNHGYPNNHQLHGCIQDVSYKGKSLNMTIFGSGIQNKCEKVCTNNVCNDGKCYETFATKPICDCTHSFMNGKYCNTSGINVTQGSIQSNFTIFKFKFIKLTWKSDSDLIFYMANKKFSFKIEATESLLYVLYEEKDEMNYQIKSIITDKYKRNTNFTIFITFETKFICFKYKTANISGEIPVPRNIYKELITLLIFLNGTGIIDMVYKNKESEYVWNDIRNLRTTGVRKNVNIYSKNVVLGILSKFQLENLSKQVSSSILSNKAVKSPIQNKDDNEKPKLVGKILGIVVESIILLVLLLLLWKYKKKYSKMSSNI